MAELSEQIQTSKNLVEQLIELLHVPSDHRYQKFTHSRDYSLFVEYSGTGVNFPGFRVSLTRKCKSVTGQGKGRPIEDTLMGFQKDVTDGSMSCGGHGDMAEVVKGLEEIHSLHTKVLAPIKELIQTFMPVGDHEGAYLSLDVLDVMLVIEGSSQAGYSLMAYRGTISPHPSNVSVMVRFDKDQQVKAPIRCEGELEKVYRTMEFVLGEVRKGAYRIIKQEIKNA